MLEGNEDRVEAGAQIHDYRDLTMLRINEIESHWPREDLHILFERLLVFRVHLTEYWDDEFEREWRNLKCRTLRGQPRPTKSEVYAAWECLRRLVKRHGLATRDHVRDDSLFSPLTA